MNEAIKTIMSRRSIRSFQDTQISDDELNIILDAARYAPSGMNFQSWHFTVVQNQEKLLALNELVKTAIDNMKTDEEKSTGKDVLTNYNFYYNAPTLIIVSNDGENTNGNADCACALENIFLAAHSFSIGSCWINQLTHFYKEAGFADIFNELGIPKNHRVYGAAALGYTLGEVPLAGERRENTVTFCR